MCLSLCKLATPRLMKRFLSTFKNLRVHLSTVKIFFLEINHQLFLFNELLIHLEISIWLNKYWKKYVELMDPIKIDEFVYLATCIFAFFLHMKPNSFPQSKWIKNSQKQYRRHVLFVLVTVLLILSGGPCLFFLVIVSCDFFSFIG